MIMDAQNRPSHQQSLAGAAATTFSTDSIDLLVAHANPGRAGGIRAIAKVVTAFTGGTNVKAELVSSANSDLSSPTVLATGETVADAAAVAGKTLLDVPMPDTAQRYVGFRYTTTGTHTTGKVTAGFVGGSDRLVGNIPMNTGLSS